MSNYPIHSDFKKYARLTLPMSLVLLPLMNAVLAVAPEKTGEAVSAAKIAIPGYQDKAIALTIYQPKDIEKNAPCLIYFHGGAFVLQAAPHQKRLACAYALKTPCKVIFVDYRLAPKNAFPIGAEDCFDAFQWVCRHADELNIDRDRIAVGGDSAGGALAAAVCLMARDRKAGQICFQMLIYPVTDARQITDSMKRYHDTPMWNSKLNKKMWAMYLASGIGCKREYASPMEAESLEELPDAYVEVSEFDCLRDEGINFAQALGDRGIAVELNKTMGTVHGFDIAENSDVVRLCVESRIAALKKAFYR